jgi:hypothetical protein
VTKITIVGMQLVRKALVTLTIEQALLEIGGPSLLNEVLRLLYEKCQCYLPDCFDNPENFKRVWKEIGEGTCNVMVDLVQERLEEFSYQKSIENFLVNLHQLKCIQR